jgi:ankyrin repeat protein
MPELRAHLMSLNDNNTPAAQLDAAIKAKDLQACVDLLDAGASPNQPKVWWGDPPLVRALDAHFVEGALLLLERGAGPCAKKVGESIPLATAATLGQVEACIALLRHGAEVDETGVDGQTPLFLAAARTHVDVCRILLEHGANVNAVARSGSTPMRVASTIGNDSAPEVLRLLLSAGAQTTDVTTHSNTMFDMPLTAFQCAVAHGRVCNVAMMMDEFGEDPQQTTADGKTMLELASKLEVQDLLRAAIAERAVAAELERTASAQGLTDSEYRAAQAAKNTFGVL